MKKVVYVEDEPINAFVFKRLLKNEYEVVHFPDGESCMSGIDAHQPEAFFIDINLGRGNMDGVETMRALRKKESLYTVPMIALTAFAFPEDEKRFIDQGFDYYVSKPIKRDLLLKIIAKFIL